ncbi:hypothetical protein ACEPAG_8884 [Sanghuangporus baumii]
MSTTLPPHETFKLTLRKRHLEQLRHVQISAVPLPGSPGPSKRAHRSRKQFQADNRNGQSRRIQSNFDSVTAVLPVIPGISTWSHVDNVYQANDSASPQALSTEIDIQADVDLKPWNFSYHSTEAYSQNICDAPTTGPKIKIDLIQQLLDEAGPAPTES